MIIVGSAQMGPVAPWLDITNSHQKYLIRTHRWKANESVLECSPEQFPTLAEPEALLVAS